MRPCLLAVLVLAVAPPHDGPDPVLHWLLRPDRVKGATVRALLGPDLKIVGELEAVDRQGARSLYFDGKDMAVVADDLAAVRHLLPATRLTASAWVSVQQPQAWGGIVGVLQDNGGAERGWILGYDEKAFYFGLATAGADDGDGKMTYLKGGTPYEKGRLYHVAATYDGAEMRLYVNGKLDGSSKAQSGAILYPARAPVVIGAYKDFDEDFRHRGRIREVAVYDVTAKPRWVAHEFEHGKALAAAAPFTWIDPNFELVVPPYLQYVTQTGITVMWETTRPATSVVHYGETAQCELSRKIEGTRSLHEVPLAALKPGTGYFYRVESTDSEGRTLETPVSTFQTAVTEGTPFTFAIISDTQSNLLVARQIAGHAWEQRPHFMLLPGDLVGTGTTKSDWTDVFFPSVGELVSRVAFFPVLGNHERNADHYYRYVSLPSPEYHYRFRYGNAEFFMIDSNKNVGPDSEQYRWLEEQLRACQATWKFVCYHHPAYSSDENDYGDMWKGKSTHGDERMRPLTALYDRHGVDIVFNGHIHSYERTWPVHSGKVVEDGGTIYMITGGGGGSLETPGPIKPWFSNNVRRGHHYCMVAVNGRTLEFKAFDLENRLFDVLRVKKP